MGAGLNTWSPKSLTMEIIWQMSRALGIICDSEVWGASGAGVMNLRGWRVRTTCLIESIPQAWSGLHRSGKISHVFTADGSSVTDRAWLPVLIFPQVSNMTSPKSHLMPRPLYQKSSFVRHSSAEREGAPAPPGSSDDITKPPLPSRTHVTFRLDYKLLDGESSRS